MISPFLRRDFYSYLEIYGKEVFILVAYRGEEYTVEDENLLENINLPWFNFFHQKGYIFIIRLNLDTYNITHLVILEGTLVRVWFYDTLDKFEKIKINNHKI